MMDQTINQEAVEGFVAGAKNASPEQIKTVVARLRSFLGRAERPVFAGQKVNDATVQAVIDRLAGR